MQETRDMGLIPGSRSPEDPLEKTKIMASDPITSWQIDRETMETVRDFIFLGSKITAAMVSATMKLKDTCSSEEKL